MTLIVTLSILSGSDVLPLCEPGGLELLEHVHALDDLAEDRVLAVEPRRRRRT